MKTLYKFLGCFFIACCVFGGTAVSASAETPVTSTDTVTEDMAKIKTRLKDYFLTLDTIDDGAKVETCFVSKAKDYMDTIQADGSWKDVDYTSTVNASNGKAWSPYLALDRMQAMAIAYASKGNALYQNKDVVKALDNALLYWKNAKPYSTGWWQNDIGVDLRFGRIGLFLENELSPEALDVITGTLTKEGVSKGTGQNNLWYDQNAIYRALLTNDPSQLKKDIDDCLSYVLVLQKDNTTAEALQVDNSLYFHGVQFYSNGYGLSMFRDMSFWLYVLRDTSFGMDQEVVDRMSDFMLDGTAWTIRKDIQELYLGYRPYKFDVGYSDYADEYIEPLKRMMAVDTKRSAEYEVLLDNIQGKRNDNGLNGNNYMWRVGYASHMRPGYGVNVKMDSSRIIGGEWRGSWTGENYGNLIYWTASAASTISVDGDEYNSVFPTYDWAHCPGVTSPARLVPDFSNYGRVKNVSDRTMGVSDGAYGNTAYTMDKKETQGEKGYFFFDDEFVALGAGITSKDSASVHTTLNQCKAENVIVDGNPVADGAKAKKYTGKTIYNDKVGYIFPQTQDFYVSNTTQKDNPSLWDDSHKEDSPATFTAWVDHGIAPQNSSYEYIVLPNTTAEKVKDYSQNIPITIVKNTSDIQAVRHDGLKETQINFYKAGTLEYAPGKTISVDQPCSIMLNEKGAIPIISLGVADTDYEETINVTLNCKNQTTTTRFVSEPAPYTGKTMTLNAGENNIYTASSEADGHSIDAAFDCDSTTYYQSDANENQEVTFALGKNTFISNLSIDWKDNYAKNYKVQTSSDGVNYTELTQKIDGDGGMDTISVNKLARFIKIICLESSHQAGYEIKEITTANGENLSKGKSVTVSSTSAKDKGNIASYAVDGNAETRWSSERNSDAESLMVDLGSTSTVYAVHLQWESAMATNYSIDVSDDQTTWHTAKALSGNTEQLNEIVFTAPVTGRYLRVKSTKSAAPNYGISIIELEVYGNEKKTTIKEVPVESLKLGLGGIQTVKIGKTLDLQPIVTPANATNPAITWKVSKPDGISIDEKGTLTAKKTGIYRITASTKNGQTAIVTVRVTQ